MAREKIPARVKPLLDALNGIPHVTNVTYDEGAYQLVEEDGLRQTVSRPLSLTFYVKDGYERKFEEVIRVILEQTSPPNEGIAPKVYKFFYLKPNQLPFLNWLWRLEVNPTQGVTGPYDTDRWEREVRDTVSTMTRIIKAYAQHLDDF